MQDRSDRLLAKELQILNRHLAKSKRSLESLLMEDSPSIELRDNTKHFFDRAELKKLAQMLPQEMHSRLFLPIYIELGSARFGSGTARISGEAECLLVAKVLGREASGGEMFVYKPELRTLRRELKTTTQYMFTLVSGGN